MNNVNKRTNLAIAAAIIEVGTRAVQKCIVPNGDETTKNVTKQVATDAVAASLHNSLSRGGILK